MTTKKTTVTKSTIAKSIAKSAMRSEYGNKLTTIVSAFYNRMETVDKLFVSGSKSISAQLKELIVVMKEKKVDVTLAALRPYIYPDTAGLSNGIEWDDLCRKKPFRAEAQKKVYNICRQLLTTKKTKTPPAPTPPAPTAPAPTAPAPTPPAPPVPTTTPPVDNNNKQGEGAANGIDLPNPKVIKSEDVEAFYAREGDAQKRVNIIFNSVINAVELDEICILVGLLNDFATKKLKTKAKKKA